MRRWMMRAGLWQARKQHVPEVHLWRPRRERFGELVQWDTSEHDWLQSRGELRYLVTMIDDATSRVFARFVRHNSSGREDMAVLEQYLCRFGRPLEFYTESDHYLSHHAEKEPSGTGRAFATDTDRTRSAGTRHRLDCRAFSSSQRTGGRSFRTG